MTGTLPVNGLENRFNDVAHQSTRTLQSDGSQGEYRNVSFHMNSIVCHICIRQIFIICLVLAIVPQIQSQRKEPE